VTGRRKIIRRSFDAQVFYPGQTVKVLTRRGRVRGTFKIRKVETRQRRLIAQDDLPKGTRAGDLLQVLSDDDRGIQTPDTNWENLGRSTKPQA
jgi:hypothetical protein